MQTKTSQSEIKNILIRLKSALGVVTDTELAEALGVKQNTISTWKTRGTIDFPLVISKCDNIDLNWLFLGEGSMLRADGLKASAQSIVHERDPRDVEMIADKNKIIQRDEELIAALRYRIGELEGRGFRTEDLGGAQSVATPSTQGINPHRK
ncbi:MAG: helix-turn-helix domain containing protein [Rikenellaceae bacterium]|jgi:hypothetical protein|nr:helix-turn-helix domain containing protein [Rikenellaceae bacterium]